MESSLDFKRDIKRSSFQIGEVLVVPTRDLLIQREQSYSLEPLVMDLLCILAERPGDVLTREELVDRLWDKDHGSDECLTRAVSVLRKSLRETGANDEYIETIPKRGYRVTRPVSGAEAPNIRHDPIKTDTYQNNKGSLLPTVLIVLIISIPIVIVTAIGI